MFANMKVKMMTLLEFNTLYVENFLSSFFNFFKPMKSAMLLLRTGQTVGMLGLARLAACRGDVVMTTAFLMLIGVSKKKGETSLPYFGVKLSCVCLVFACRKK